MNSPRTPPIIVFTILALVTMVVSFAPPPAQATATEDVSVIVEAEDFAKEEGGQVAKTTDRPGTSGNVCITSWDNDGHILEWQVDISQEGEYQIVLRYAGGRAWKVYRELQIDGSVPGDAFKKISWEPTGGFCRNASEWKNLVVTDSNKQPALVNLSKGKHTVRMTNLGGDGANGGGNLDLFAFLSKDAKLDALNAAMKFPTPTPLPPLKAPTPDPSIKIDPGTPVGFASINGGTTGGKGGPAYIVSDKDTFKMAVSDDQPRIIVISGTITLDLGTPTRVGSNKTILGLTGAKIVQGGLSIENKKNVIIQNIIFEDAHDPNPGWPATKASADNVTIDRGSTNIWVDHCTFSDGPHVDNESQNHDGSLDVSGGNYVTVSYNHFYNHDKVNLIGSDDKNVQDRGLNKVTFHHNFFEGTIERHPRVRFGEVHVYNNYYKGVQLYGIGIGVEAKIYSEANYFENVLEPWRFYDNQDMPGYIKDIGSFLANSGKVEARPSGITWEPSKYYTYQADPAQNVKDIVLKNVGAAKVQPTTVPTPAPTVAPTATPTTTPTTAPTIAPTATAKPTETRAAAAPTTCNWTGCLAMPADWYGSAEAIRIADNLLLYQRNVGGWQKDTEMASVLTAVEKTNLTASKAITTDVTIDNNATTSQIVYLARVASHNTPNQERYKDAALKGIDYVLAAQYENGGWPQFYPNQSGYYGHITFNDNAMVNVMNFLTSVAADPMYSFVDKDRRDKATKAVQKGIDVTLKSQIVVNGKKTAWCAQHDEKTLAPAAARAYELPSISGQESVGIVRFLMGIDKPGPEVIDAIQAAVKWMDDSKLTSIQVVEKMDPSLPNGFDRIVVENPNAPPIWGRFYEISTNKVFFVGRDGVKKNTLAEIEQERRSGYAYYTSAPANLLAIDYPAWQQKWAPNVNVLKQVYAIQPTSTPRPTAVPTSTPQPSPTLAVALTTVKPNVPASLNFPANSILLEAESAPQIKGVKMVEQPGAAGSAIDVAKDAKALYEVELPAVAGNCWYVWMRYWATDGNMDSFWIGMDGATPTLPEKTSDGGIALRIFASPGDSANTTGDPYKVWFWDANKNHPDPRGCFQVTAAGKYRLWVMGRETGTILDQILLTPDKDFDVEQALKGAPISIK